MTKKQAKLIGLVENNDIFIYAVSDGSGTNNYYLESWGPLKSKNKPPKPKKKLLNEKSFGELYEGEVFEITNSYEKRRYTYLEFRYSLFKLKNYIEKNARTRIRT
ncbi:MAG: hypothetical protein KKB62_02690 [Nanoarchaeota archaeon]|nr:hypothetical protein [Nanoarchaeota archaeon]